MIFHNIKIKVTLLAPGLGNASLQANFSKASTCSGSTSLSISGENRHSSLSGMASNSLCSTSLSFHLRTLAWWSLPMLMCLQSNGHHCHIIGVREKDSRHRIADERSRAVWQIVVGLRHAALLPNSLGILRYWLLLNWLFDRSENRILNKRNKIVSWW